MATRKISLTDIQVMFNAAERKARYSGRIPGIMGIEKTTGNYTYDVPGGRGWKYVRLVNSSGDVYGSTQAVNDGNVSDSGTQEIWLDVNNENKLAIIGPRLSSS